MFAAGIDYSTHAVDLVLVDLNGARPPFWHRFELKGQDAWERTRTVRHMLPGRTSELWDTVLAFGLEEPRGKNTGVMYRVQGAILASLPPHVLIYPMVPSQWRKLNGLKGSAKKSDIFDHSLRLNIGFGALLDENWPQDAHDAHLIAHAVQHLLAKEPF